MKRVFIAFALAALTAFPLCAQDLITKKDGTDIKAIVEEVGSKEVKYKEYSNPEGPVYSLPKSDVLMIIYENGKKEIMGQMQNTIPDGVMTLDWRSGKLAINGMAIDKKSTYLYLSPEAEAMYKSGDIISSIGDGMMAGGIGFAGGYLIGSLISKGDIKRDLPVYGVCAGIAILGIPLHFIGVNKIKKAINDYNTKHGFAQTSPEVSFGVQNYGIGLAINF
jgi:hypothetical protein